MCKTSILLRFHLQICRARILPPRSARLTCFVTDLIFGGKPTRSLGLATVGRRRASERGYNHTRPPFTLSLSQTPMVGPALARRAAGARAPPGPSGCVPRRAAPRCRSSHDGKAPDSEPGEEWERNYERHVARKPEIFPLPRTEEERMRRSEALHEWHEHQYRMLELVSKLQTASSDRQED